MQDRCYKLEFLAHAFTQVLNGFVPPAFHLKAFEPELYFTHRITSAQSFQLRQVQDLFADLHFFIEAPFFGHVTNLNEVVQWIEFFAIEMDVTAVRVKDPGDHTQQCGFARPVGTKQSKNTALLKRETDIIYRFLGSIIFFQVSEFKKIVHSI